jgi:hypothetical protein
MRQRIGPIIGAIAFTALTAWGQPAPAPVAGTITTAGGRQPTVMLKTEQGMMVLTNGVLAKYDSKTLEEKGTVALLPELGPQPTRPAFMDQTTRQAYQDLLAEWNATAALYRETPAMADLGQYVLIVMGDQFYRVDSETMKIEVQSSVVDTDAQAADQTATTAVTGGTPMLALNGTALYVLRGEEMSVIEIKEGKVLANATLPVEMTGPIGGTQPRQPNLGGGGRPGQTTTETSMIGTIVNHVDIEGGIWTVKLDTGDEYVLGGTALENLLMTDGIEGKRVQVTGTAVTGTDAAQYGKGTFSVKSFQIVG